MNKWAWSLALVGLGVFAYWFFQGRACTVTTEAAVVRASFFREDTVLPGYTLSVPINLRCSGFGHLAALWQVEGQTVAATATNLRLGSSGFSQELEPEKGVYAVDLTLSPINADEPGTLQELSFHFVSSNGYLDWLLNEKNMARFHKGRDVVVPVDVRVDYDPRRVTPLPFVYGGPVMTTESEAHRLRVGQWYQLSLDAPLTVGKLVMTTPDIENVTAGWTTEADPSSDSLWNIRDSLTKATPIVPEETTTLPAGPVVLFVSYDLLCFAVINENAVKADLVGVVAARVFNEFELGWADLVCSEVEGAVADGGVGLEGREVVEQSRDFAPAPVGVLDAKLVRAAVEVTVLRRRSGLI